MLQLCVWDGIYGIYGKNNEKVYTNQFTLHDALVNDIVYEAQEVANFVWRNDSR